MDKKEKPSITFNPRAPGLEKFWGPLQTQVMELIWDNGPMTVKRAQYFLSKREKYAYTTVMTVMNRLARRGFLEREKKGHSFTYKSPMKRDDFLKFAVGEIFTGLYEDFRDYLPRSIKSFGASKKGPRR
jgi:predicted transcriptional regulator